MLRTTREELIADLRRRINEVMKPYKGFAVTPSLKGNLRKKLNTAVQAWILDNNIKEPELILVKSDVKIDGDMLNVNLTYRKE